MKLDQLVPGAASIDITGITADSRKVKPGYLFAALQGVASDGRSYIDARNQGRRCRCAHR
jgi:UDP-N-acetylmuramoyl-L-alanyl-D-glutamate--2,6-diaminopimelate ligase